MAGREILHLVRREVPGHGEPRPTGFVARRHEADKRVTGEGDHRVLVPGERSPVRVSLREDTEDKLVVGEPPRAHPPLPHRGKLLEPGLLHLLLGEGGGTDDLTHECHDPVEVFRKASEGDEGRVPPRPHLEPGPEALEHLGQLRA